MFRLDGKFNGSIIGPQIFQPLDSVLQVLPSNLHLVMGMVLYFDIFYNYRIDGKPTNLHFTRLPSKGTVKRTLDFSKMKI